MIVLGGNVRIHFESTTEQFEIIIQKAYQLGIEEEEEEVLAIPIDDAVSWITIEQHDTTGTDSADTTEGADTIEITSGVNDAFDFRHALALTSNYSGRCSQAAGPCGGLWHGPWARVVGFA